MALDQRKRQRKVEKRKAKQRANKNRSLGRQPLDLFAQFTRAAQVAPILHCVTIADIWTEGMGQVLMSRELAKGQVAFVAFLVDMYCLGVKNVMMEVAPRNRYQRQIYERLGEQFHLQKLQPTCARKLVEGAVEYAAQFGIPPHKDYRTARLIFGDVDAAACEQQFEFGKDGKPLFIAGPNDTGQRCRQILTMLEQSCGPDGYHFIMPMGGPPIGVDLQRESAKIG